MTPSMDRLCEELRRLPGIGAKTAERLAYDIVRRPVEEALALADAIRGIREKTRPCSGCGHLDETDPCGFCCDSGRDATQICVVEESRDLYVIERLGEYRGLYHVLGRRVAPFAVQEGFSLDLEGLLRRVRAGGVVEVIVATNADVEGDATALRIDRALEGAPVRVTRLARGLPSGCHIEFAGSGVLREALALRRELSIQGEES